MAVTHSLDLEASSSQYASIADASCPNLEISGSQTWEAWIKTESTGGNKVIAAKGKASTANYHQMAVNGSTEQFDFYLVGLTTNNLCRSNLVIQTGVWYHVAGVYDSSAGKLRVYINGELDKEVTAGGSASDSNSNFAIGCNFSGGSDAAASFFDGLLRNVRVWNVARTQAQIRADMNVDTPSDTTGLQGNWILNNAYTDSSGNGYTLTPSGSPVFSTTYPDALDLAENTNWTKKHKITIDNTKVAGSADLTDFPFVLTESNFLAEAFSNSLNGGADLRFSLDVEGKQRLAHEVVSWDTTGSTGEVWVKINTLSYNTDTDIYVHYGNSGASALNENEAFGKHQVWGANWKGVWHFQSSSVDSTSNSNDGTDSNISYGSSSGDLGNGASFNGSSSKIMRADNASLDLTGSYTILSRIKPVLPSSNQFAQIVSKYDTGAPAGVGGYGFYLFNNAGTQRIEIGHHTGSAAPALNVNHTLSEANFSNVDVVWNGTTFVIYVNGSSIGSGASASGNPANNAKALNIGTFGSLQSNSELGRWFNGSMDNLMIYSGALSADFITTLYNNQNSPSTFAIPVSGFTPKVIFI